MEERRDSPGLVEGCARELMPLLSVRDVAEICGVSAGVIRRIIDRGELPVCHVGPRLIRISREDLAHYLRSMREGARR